MNAMHFPLVHVPHLLPHVLPVALRMHYFLRNKYFRHKMTRTGTNA
jgi:hypothetical protein